MEATTRFFLVGLAVWPVASILAQSTAGGPEVLSSFLRGAPSTPGQPDDDFIDADESAIMRRHLASDFGWTTGTKSVAIVRVSAPDSQPMYSMDEIVDAILGEDRISVKTQYEACSFGALQFVANGTNEVLLDKNITTYTTRLAMRNAAKTKLASMTGQNVNQLADKVVFCYAKNSAHATWFATASLYHWRVQLNDGWCTSLSGSVHEIGHTMGFKHSGLGTNDYGDATCQMGAGSKAPLIPQKCFNGDKFAQSGWFANKQLSLSVESIGDLQRPIALGAFVDADKVSSTSHVKIVISLDDSLYIVFNRAKSFNWQTGALKDQVTITKDGSDWSRQLAGLKANDTYVLSNYSGDGNDLVIKHCAARFGDDVYFPDVAFIALGWNTVDCNVPKCFETEQELRTAVAAYLADPSPSGVKLAGHVSVFRGVSMFRARNRCFGHDQRMFRGSGVSVVRHRFAA